MRHWHLAIAGSDVFADADLAYEEVDAFTMDSKLGEDDYGYAGRTRGGAGGSGSGRAGGSAKITRRRKGRRKNHAAYRQSSAF